MANIYWENTRALCLAGHHGDPQNICPTAPVACTWSGLTLSWTFQSLEDRDCAVPVFQLLRMDWAWHSWWSLNRCWEMEGWMKKGRNEEENLWVFLLLHWEPPLGWILELPQDPCSVLKELSLLCKKFTFRSNTFQGCGIMQETSTLCSTFGQTGLAK